MLSNINITPVDTISKNIVKIIDGEDINIPERTINYISSTVDTNIIGDYRLKETGAVISIKHENDKWYAIIPKRYGVRYSIEMKPVYRNNNIIRFVTEFINEELTLIIGNPTLIEYMDCDNRRFMGSAID